MVTYVTTETRAIAYDETVFKSPHEFRPERFLEGDALDPDVFAFGFGRR